MIEVLYRDEHIVVCIKPAGILSQEGKGEDMPGLIKKQLGAAAVYPVHRLDKAVSGVMVYGLSAAAAAGLSRAVQERSLEKIYLAVLRGIPQEASGVLEDLLFHDKTKNKTYVVQRLRKGVKPAKLSYELLETAGEQALVRVRLHTGRTNQIRVQFASRRLPLVGDGRYGGKDTSSALGLWSAALVFRHPVTGERMVCSKEPPSELPWSAFNTEGDIL